MDADRVERCTLTSAAALLVFRGIALLLLLLLLPSLPLSVSLSRSPLLPWQHISCMEIASLTMPTAGKKWGGRLKKKKEEETLREGFVQNR